MNKDNAAQFLPLVQALAEGKTIQLRHSSDNWMDHSNPDFGLAPVNYRIKPEPLVRYMVKGSCDEYTYRNFDSATTCAERLSKHHNCEYTVHKMVEDL